MAKKNATAAKKPAKVTIKAAPVKRKTKCCIVVKNPVNGGKPRRVTQKAGSMSLPWEAATSKKVAKTYYGGSFPSINGNVHTYPDQGDEVAWMKLIRAAVAFDKARVKAVAEGRPTRDCADKRLTYLLYHASPKQIQRRGTRNLHRRKRGLEPGDDRHVHHTNPKTMSLKGTRIVTHCEHQRAHGRQCADERKRR